MVWRRQSLCNVAIITRLVCKEWLKKCVMNYELDFFIPRMHRGRHRSMLLARMDTCMWVGIIWNICSLVKISLNNFTNMNNSGPIFLFWFFDEHLSLLTRQIPSSSDLRHNHFWCTWTLSILSLIKKKGSKHSALKEHVFKRSTNHSAFQYTVTNLKSAVINDYGGTSPAVIGTSGPMAL